MDSGNKRWWLTGGKDDVSAKAVDEEVEDCFGADRHDRGRVRATPEQTNRGGVKLVTSLTGRSGLKATWRLLWSGCDVVSS
jgi:hypothetical protein